MKQYVERGLTGIRVIAGRRDGRRSVSLAWVRCDRYRHRARIYSADHPSDKNKKFVADYQKAFGTRPGFMAAGGWDGIDLIYQALKKTSGNADR